MIYALLKHKWSFCIAAAGFLSGSAILYLFAAWPLFHFVKPGRKGEFYNNVDDMAAFFINNRDDFEYLESYFSEDREWEFTFYQYESEWHGGHMTYRYRTIGGNIWMNYHDVLEEDEISIVSENLKEFLDFAAGGNEIWSIVLHGDADVLDPHDENKRYLEVRCYEGEEIISYLYAPLDPLNEDNWEQLMPLEDGWYLGIDQYIPVKLEETVWEY